MAVVETVIATDNRPVRGWEDLLGLPLGVTGQVGEGELRMIQDWIEEQLDESLYEVRRGDHTRTGSDAYLDKMMNFDSEYNAIVKYRQNMWREMSGYTEEEKERTHKELLFKWLSSEYLFFLAENGCGKHLEVQPIYVYVLCFVDGEPQMKMVDIRKFGEHSKSFVEANEVVGNGLLDMYVMMCGKPGGSVGVVMSPSNLYVKYDSSTDVLNINWGKENEDGELVVEGQYWMFNRILNDEQRRFLHNAAKVLGLMGSVSVSQVDLDWLAKNIPVDRLMIDGETSGFTEPQLLARYPGVFEVDGGVDVDGLREFFSELFEHRFGEKLFDEIELSMYSVIHQLVESYLPLLHERLWIKKDKYGYYDLLRTMQYQCQAIYSLKKSEQKGMNTNDSLSYMRDHLLAIRLGWLRVGWVGEEMMPGTDPVSGGYDYSVPPGFEKTDKDKYCKKHDNHYVGDECPKCKGLKSDGKMVWIGGFSAN